MIRFGSVCIALITIHFHIAYALDVTFPSTSESLLTSISSTRNVANSGSSKNSLKSSSSADQSLSRSSPFSTPLKSSDAGPSSSSKSFNPVSLSLTTSDTLASLTSPESSTSSASRTSPASSSASSSPNSHTSLPTSSPFSDIITSSTTTVNGSNVDISAILAQSVASWARDPACTASWRSAKSAILAEEAAHPEYIVLTLASGQPQEVTLLVPTITWITLFGPLTTTLYTSTAIIEELQYTYLSRQMGPGLPYSFANSITKDPLYAACCGQCELNIVKADVFYWPGPRASICSNAGNIPKVRPRGDQLPSRHRRAVNARGEMKAVNIRQASEGTVISLDGFTYTSPSIYFSLKNVQATDGCGTRGPLYSNLIVGFPPEEVSSESGSTWVLADFDDLQCPPPNWTPPPVMDPVYPLSKPTFTTDPKYINSVYWNGEGYPWAPGIVVPSAISNYDPTWQYCENMWIVYDPPIALTKVPSLDPTTTAKDVIQKPTSPPTPEATPTHPSPSKTVQPSVPVATTDPPKGPQSSAQSSGAGGGLGSYILWGLGGKPSPQPNDPATLAPAAGGQTPPALADPTVTSGMSFTPAEPQPPAVIVHGQTVTQNAPGVRIGSISVVYSGDYVYVGTASAAVTAPAPVSIDGMEVSALPPNGQTVTVPGASGPAATASGVPVSLGDGYVVYGSSTIFLPASSSNSGAAPSGSSSLSRLRNASSSAPTVAVEWSNLAPKTRGTNGLAMVLGIWVIPAALLLELAARM